MYKNLKNVCNKINYYKVFEVKYIENESNLYLGYN